MIEWYRRAARRRGWQAQIDAVRQHLINLAHGLAPDPSVRIGAALAVAEAALELSISPVEDERERDRRHAFLREIVRPALDANGYKHVNDLIEASLAVDIKCELILSGSQAQH